MSEHEWTWEWPTEAGTYWFFGWNNGYAKRHSPPRMHLARVHITASLEPAYVSEGHILYRAEGAMGKWLPAVLPERPEL